MLSRWLFAPAQEEKAIREHEVGSSVYSEPFDVRQFFARPAKLELPPWVPLLPEVILWVPCYSSATDGQLTKRIVVGLSQKTQKLVDGGSNHGLHDEPYGPCSGH
jgi:hypothetical protein